MNYSYGRSYSADTFIIMFVSIVMLIFVILVIVRF